MAVIRKIKLQKACYQAVTKATTKNSHSNDRFGFKLVVMFNISKNDFCQF